MSRFDPWKDPLGVIDVYRLVRKEVPGLQLALIGSIAHDDPEVSDIYKVLVAEARGDDDIHVLTNIIGVGDVEVNAFQTFSDVVIQKSIREGFGLVVSETMWKGTPVVANRSGGIPLQMGDGVGGFLVDSREECAERALYLLRHRQEARNLGLAGRERVRRHSSSPACSPTSCACWRASPSAQRRGRRRDCPACSIRSSAPYDGTGAPRAAV